MFSSLPKNRLLEKAAEHDSGDGTILELGLWRDSLLMLRVYPLKLSYFKLGDIIALNFALFKM